MAIRTGISPAPIALAAVSTDTTLLAAITGSRLQVTALSLYNNAASPRTVGIYDSSNTTSASGTLIATYTIDAGASVDVVEMIGQGLAATRNLIGRQTTGGALLGDVNAKITYTNFSAAEAAT